MGEAQRSILRVLSLSLPGRAPLSTALLWGLWALAAWNWAGCVFRLCPSLPTIQRGRIVLGKAQPVPLIAGHEGRQQKEQPWLFLPLVPQPLEPRGCWRRDPGVPGRNGIPSRVSCSQCLGERALLCPTPGTTLTADHGIRECSELGG